jgi:hypothetical protein
MARTLVGALVGLILGGVITFYMFVGVPGASHAPGSPISPPDPNAPQPGTAQIVLRQEFFNNVLDVIFRDMAAPAFPLTMSGQPDPNEVCPSRITVLREGSGVQTSVRFDNNSLSAPLAFSGSYNSMFGCFQFTGWAQANMMLRFDPSQQSVFGQLNVETVNLDGVNPVVSGIVTPLVQSTLNGRVNPILIMDGRQIAVSVPIAATNANLQASVSDVRAEVRDNALNLFVIYDFRGTPAVQ